SGPSIAPFPAPAASGRGRHRNPMHAPENAFQALLGRIATAAAGGRGEARLLAVSKGQPASAIRGLAGLGQRAFGENYVQEALAKMDALADLALEWHFIGRLQSNKCR